MVTGTEKFITLIIILALSLGILTGLLLSDKFSNYCDKQHTLIMEKKSTDTIIKLIPREPVIIRKNAVKTIVRKDTIISSEPFTARLDTVMSADTINLSYDYPENIFMLELKRKPDTSKIQTITLTYPVEKKAPWWETPAYIVGGILVGFGIGSLSK
jgi:hypothetical protein